MRLLSHIEAAASRLLGFGPRPNPHGFIEIFGEPGSGKTARALAAIAEAQRQGESALLIDCDGQFHMGLARGLQIVPARLAIARPESIEDALLMASQGINAGLGLVILDNLQYLNAKNQQSFRRVEAAALILSKQAAKAKAKVIFTKTIGANQALIEQILAPLAKTSYCSQ